ncbi:hypothetical protein QAD02_014422 [Eretmocerus hayati]|uniref:Uncharacterized protein n=1 Tax=Eretmocerus hayati TaxID=131215 RepID=A0ACC2P5H2_9HYME|nr:hypothetical protein QAD02_014422 [Eretmocerus hayati]
MDEICIAKTPIPDKWDTTRMEIIKFKYMWTISNFSFFWNNRPQAYMDSPVFSTGVKEKIKWHLRLYPNGNFYASDNGYIALYLYLESCDAPSIEAKCKFSLINSRREESNIRSSRNCHKFVGIDPHQRFTGLANFIRRDFVMDPANGLLPHDTLTVLCEIRACRGIINILGISISSQLRIQKTQPDDFGALLDSEEFSDVSLIVGCREFRVHKAILAARSPVFLAMFKNDMKEKYENIVEIPDIDERVMREVLRFIYAERVEKIHELANDLLAAAEKYSLEGLKMMCEEALCGKLTVHNAADVLALADMYNADCLKTQVIHFLAAHGKDPSLWTKYLNSADSSTSIFSGLPDILSNYLKLMIIFSLCAFISVLMMPHLSLLIDPMCHATTKFCAPPPAPHKDLVMDTDTISAVLRKMQKSASSFIEDLHAFILYFIRIAMNFLLNPFSADARSMSEDPE